MLSGAMDPIIPPENARASRRLLRQAGADVQHETLPAGHGLTQQDVRLTQNWLLESISRRPGSIKRVR